MCPRDRKKRSYFNIFVLSTAIIDNKTAVLKRFGATAGIAVFVK
jgi:hypothetical protein